MSRHRRRLTVLVNNSGRTCGTCSACCTALKVDDRVHKPAGEACKHLGQAGGCAIYSYRPRECVEYVCAWRVLLDMFSEEERPDRTGIVFTIRPHEGTGHRLTAQAVVDGWLELDAAKDYLEEVGERVGVPVLAVYEGKGGALYHPPVPSTLITRNDYAQREALVSKHQIRPAIFRGADG